MNEEERRTERLLGAFVLALAIGVLGTLGAGVALWASFGWAAAVGFWSALLLILAVVIMQSDE